MCALTRTLSLSPLAWGGGRRGGGVGGGGGGGGDSIERAGWAGGYAGVE